MNHRRVTVWFVRPTSLKSCSLRSCVWPVFKAAVRSRRPALKTPRIAQHEAGDVSVALDCAEAGCPNFPQTRFYLVINLASGIYNIGQSRAADVMATVLLAHARSSIRRTDKRKSLKSPRSFKIGQRSLRGCENALVRSTGTACQGVGSAGRIPRPRQAGQFVDVC